MSESSDIPKISTCESEAFGMQPGRAETIVIQKKILRRQLNGLVLRDNFRGAHFAEIAGNDLRFRVITKNRLICSFGRDVAAPMPETGMRPAGIFQPGKKAGALGKNFLKITRSTTRASIRRVPLSGKPKSIHKARGTGLTEISFSLKMI